MSCTVAGEGTKPDIENQTSTDSGTGGSSIDAGTGGADPSDTSETGTTQEPTETSDSADAESSTDSSETASCRDGVLDPDEECDDSNTDPEDGCADCHITDGYSCEGEPSICEDINECDDAPCGEQATCNNLPGSYKCSCKKGYEEEAGTCVDVNECSPGLNTCYEHSTCENTVGSYNCVCHDGFFPTFGACVCEWESEENLLGDPGFDTAETIRPNRWDSTGGALWTSTKDVNGCSESGSMMLQADIEEGQSTTYCVFVSEPGDPLWFGFSSLGTSGTTFSYELQAYESSNCVTPTRVLAESAMGPLTSSNTWTPYSTEVPALNNTEHSITITIKLDPAAQSTNTLYLDRFYLSPENSF